MVISLGLPLWVGSAFLLLAITCILRPQLWVELYGRIHNLGEVASVPVGALNIFFGTLILTFHWDWSGWAIFLTLTGLISLGEGMLFLLFPRLLPQSLGPFVQSDNRQASANMFRVMGIVILLLALAILREWDLSRTPGI